MNPFGYALSLRVRHPLLPADEIGCALGLAADRSWTTGEPRTSPAGGALPGVHDSTYWSARIAEEQGALGATLLTALASLVERLEESEAFIRSVNRSGGSMAIFLGLFGDRNFGLTLSPKLLSRLAALEIGLEMDVYP